MKDKGLVLVMRPCSGPGGAGMGENQVSYIIPYCLNTRTVRPSGLLQSICPREMKVYVRTNLKEPTFPSTWYIHTVKYYSATKRGKILITLKIDESQKHCAK